MKYSNHKNTSNLIQDMCLFRGSAKLRNSNPNFINFPTNDSSILHQSIPLGNFPLDQDCSFGYQIEEYEKFLTNVLSSESNHFTQVEVQQPEMQIIEKRRLIEQKFETKQQESTLQQNITLKQQEELLLAQ